MFPSLAARETNVADANFASWKQGNVSESTQKHFCFIDANFASERSVFPSLATQGNMSGNNVSATMFPSLAGPLKPYDSRSHDNNDRMTSCL